MAHPSDIGPALVALGAEVVIANPDGQKELPISKFFLGPNNLAENILKLDEFLEEIRIPSQGKKTNQLFLKQRLRQSADFAISSVAIAAQMSNGICDAIRIVLGGVAPFPYSASLAEEQIIKGKKLNVELIAQAGELAVAGARALPMNRFKVDLTRSLVRHALTSIWQGAADFS